MSGSSLHAVSVWPGKDHRSESRPGLGGALGGTALPLSRSSAAIALDMAAPRVDRTPSLRTMLPQGSLCSPQREASSR